MSQANSKTSQAKQGQDFSFYSPLSQACLYMQQLQLHTREVKEQEVIYDWQAATEWEQQWFLTWDS